MKTIDQVTEAILNGHDKFSADEMTPALIVVAVQYVGQYISGPKHFDYMVEMWHQINKSKKNGKGPEYQLSAGQAKGVLNVMRAELLREREAKKAAAIQLDDGEYTIGDWKFKIETQPDHSDFAPGETIISYPGKKKPWLGFGFVRGNKLQAWKRYLEDSSSAGMLVAAELLLIGRAKAKAA